MKWLMCRLLLVFFLGFIFGPRCEPTPKKPHLRLIPSVATPRVVVFSHFTRTLPQINPRLEVINKVRELFPRIEIWVANDSNEKSLERYPDLLRSAQKIVHFESDNIQDNYEFGWDDERQEYASFIFEELSEYSKNWENKFPQLSRYLVPKGAATQLGHKGGNIEVLPDGTPVVGNTMGLPAREFFSQFSPSQMIEVVDTSWLYVGHVDEIFLWANDPFKKHKCLMFVPSLRMGENLITADAINEFNEFEKVFWAEFTKRATGLQIGAKYFEYPQNESERKLSQVVKGILRAEDWAMPKSLSKITQKIESSTKRLMEHPSMKECRVIEVPQLFRPDKDGQNWSPMFQNQINSLVIENHVFAYQPHLPAQKRAVEKVFQDNGFNVHWFERSGSNSLGGNLHCDTNTLRDSKETSSD